MREGAPIEDDAAEPVRRKVGRPARERTAAINEVRPEIPAAREASVRPDVRPDSVREAEEYARQVLEDFGDSIDKTDEFYAPPPPDGWDYQWKRVSVADKPDTHYMTMLLHSGWRAVDISRHPELMPAGYKGAIQKKGLALMEKPLILVERARKRERQDAIEQKQNAESALYETPSNTAPREEFPDKFGKFAKKEFMRPAGAGSD